MNRLRYTAIEILDWADHHVLRHRFYGRVCVWLASHPWRHALCSNGCKRDAEGFCVWCGWRQPLEVPRAPGGPT